MYGEQTVFPKGSRPHDESWTGGGTSDGVHEPADGPATRGNFVEGQTRCKFTYNDTSPYRDGSTQDQGQGGHQAESGGAVP